MNSKLFLLVIILMVACITSFSSDVYTPSVVSIAHELRGASINLTQLSVVIFLFGVSFSQLIFGPLSEAYGRKKPMVAGLLIMITGSSICLFAPHISVLILGRFIQGIGAGALAALWRSVFRDIMSGEELAKYSSFISIFVIFIASVAPALGGYLDQIGWRSSFLVMLLYAITALIVLLWGYQETSVHHHKDHLSKHYIINTYGRLLKSRLFMGLTCCTFLTYGALFAWITIAPALLIHQVGISSVEFGWLITLVGAAAYSIAAIVNGKTVKTLGMPFLMRMGWLIMLLSGISLLLGYRIFGVTVWSIMIPISGLYFGSTLIWSNAFATAFTPFGDIAGFAGAAYGFMQLAGGAVIGTWMSHLSDHNQLPLAVLIIITSVAALGIYQWMVMPTLTEKSP